MARDIGSMTILCGTDFSELAVGAAHIAAQIARRTGTRLRLVHVLDFHASELVDPEKRTLMQERQQQLDHEASSLREAGAQVETSVLFGNVAEALIAQASELQGDRCQSACALPGRARRHGISELARR
jgi:nucleotide-binding universal stress UspA family protein